MSMAAHVQPLANRPATRTPAWDALASHYKKVSKLHLRQLFGDDPKRGERMAVEAAGLYLDYSKNRIIDQTSGSFFNSQKNPVFRRESMPCSAARRSISQRSGRACTWPCAPLEGLRFSLMERTWCPRFIRCSTRWLISPTGCGAGRGKVIPENAFVTSSTSGLAAPISGRSWLRSAQALLRARHEFPLRLPH